MSKHTKKVKKYNVYMIHVVTTDMWVTNTRRKHSVPLDTYNITYGTNPNKTGLFTREQTAELVAEEVAHKTGHSVELIEVDLLSGKRVSYPIRLTSGRVA